MLAAVDAHGCLNAIDRGRYSSGRGSWCLWFPWAAVALRLRWGPCPISPRSSRAAPPLSAHEDAFTVSTNLTDANRPVSRKVDDPSPGDTYMLLGAPHEKYPDGMLFAGVKQQKRYVSYYLMPAYTEDGLARGMSPELRQRHAGQVLLQLHAGRRGDVRRAR